MDDIYGRKYAKVIDTNVGSYLEMDGDFTCMKDGDRKVVEADKDGVFVRCSHGRHYLEGQIEDHEDGTFYVGMYPVEEGQ